jgi:Ni,Fe-hydrogenase III component G
MSTVIGQIRDAFPDRLSRWEERHGKRFYADVADDALVPVARGLCETWRLRFITVTGTDTRAAIELLYHFSADAEGSVLSLRVTLPKERPETGSLAAHLKGAEWVERELAEMLGVGFRGHPDPRRLLLADDWPEGVYPLRHDGAGGRK